MTPLELLDQIEAALPYVDDYSHDSMCQSYFDNQGKDPLPCNCTVSRVRAARTAISELRGLLAAQNTDKSAS